MRDWEIMALKKLKITNGSGTSISITFITNQLNHLMFQSSTQRKMYQTFQKSLQTVHCQHLSRNTQ